MNANVYLLPGRRLFPVGLPASASLNIDAVDIVECDGNGSGYEVDFGIITPFRVATHFQRQDVSALLINNGAVVGRGPATHMTTSWFGSNHGAADLVGRIGIPYVGIYDLRATM